VLNPETLERLRAVVGDEHVLTDPDLRAGYESDWTRRYHGETPAIIRPASVAEVSAVVRLCREAGAPLIPQGGNTGLVGGSVPRNGELVLSLRRLDAISDFDSGPGEVTVAAGVTLARLQEFVRGHGWDFGVDLASRDSATIGGMTATNAGGIRVLRYGGMRHQVLGLEAVTSDGAIIRRMPGLLKDNSGYDLPQLLAGSEGTLAVITAVRLKLIPLRPRRAVALLGVQDLHTAIEAVSAVRRALPSLEAAEVFFPEGLDLVCRHTGMSLPLPGAHPCYLLLECASQQDESEALAGVLAGLAGIRASALATGTVERERLWAYRERHTESISAEGVPHKLDVTLPLSRLPDFERRVRGVIAAVSTSARPILFGHAGDGNLHVNILGLETADYGPDDAVFRLVAELGGSISAEHGIGIAKMPWLHLTRSPEDRAAMHAIKAALDPSGIFNPGVIIPAPGSH